MATNDNLYKTGSTVILNDVVMGDGDYRIGSTRVPRRVLHFSDGIVEEYSTDEDDEVTEYKKRSSVDSKSLPWMQWIGHQVSTAAYSTLSAADVCGEKLAWFFGITSPKYQYAIDEFNRMQAEDKEEQEREGRERAASQARKHSNTGSIESAPHSTISTVCTQSGSIEMETKRHGMSSMPLSRANYLGPFRGSTETIQCAQTVTGVHGQNSSSFPA